MPTLTRARCALLALALAGCDAEPRYLRLMEAERAAAELRVAFANANEATNRAVLADTPAASTTAATDARAARAAVRSHQDRLATLLSGTEAAPAETFAACFTTYERIDDAILTLATEQSNQAAERLFFGAGWERADAIESALGTFVADSPAATRPEATTHVLAAGRALRKLQVLEASHIPEPGEAAMTDLEGQMSALATVVDAEIAALAPLATATSRPSLDAATRSWREFEGTRTEILTLSRQNTNVRSLSLALDEKPPVFATCTAAATAMAQSLADLEVRATR